MVTIQLTLLVICGIAVLVQVDCKKGGNLRFKGKKPKLSTYNMETKYSFRFLCKYRGPPGSTVQWFFNGSILDKLPRGITLRKKNTVMVIDYPVMDYAGNYTCVVSHSSAKEPISRTFILYTVTTGPPKLYKWAPSTTKTISATNVVLWCNAYGKGKLKYQWQKDGKTIQSPLQPHLKTDDYRLSLKDVTLSDDGNYTCTVSNELSETTKTIRLMVNVINGLVDDAITEDPDNTTAELKSSVILQCALSNYDFSSIFWVYEGRGVSHTSRSFNLVKTGFRISMLFIPSVNDSDYGEYYCRWPKGNAQSKHAILLKWPLKDTKGQMKPKFPFGLKHFVRVWRNISKVLKCPAYGEKPLIYTWYKDGHKLPSTTSEFSLKIPHPCHNGNYTCQVSNKHGTISHVFRVFVADETRSKPVFEPNVLLNTSVNLGTNATLTCACTFASNAHLFRWYKWTSIPTQLDIDNPNMTLIPLFNMKRGKYKTTYTIDETLFRSELKIVNAEKSDLGWYTCCIENRFGINCDNALVHQA